MMKLTKQDVLNIFALVDEREALRRQFKCLTNVSIAEKMGVHEHTIDKILAGKIHKRVLRATN